ncbi:MAG: chemotaxis response regulator protein-glutamate methylesterase [Thermodesulfobacteriota bacterium]|nr:chemotaxis response regulator protein-glutamate methylesterase [Thermodesulfobacteriota bacterium]
MINNESLRVLVVDDTVVYRKIVSDVLDELPDVEVVGIAGNGKIAMTKIVSLRPDLVTLDIEMPEMNGLEVLENIKNELPDIGAIMLSSLTQKGGEMTMKALELGAFDFIPKPQFGTMEENKEIIKDAIAPMLKAYIRGKEIRNILNGRTVFSEDGVKRIRPEGKTGNSQYRKGKTYKKYEKSDIVAIGISTGGPNALAKMMPQLPPDIDVPILVVQHMPPVFTQSLAHSLNSKCAIEVREAVDGEPLRPNTANIAPGGKQMKIVAGADGKTRIVKITDDPPENSCKPSVDYLFRSIAHHYIGRSTGVIMTGMGSDGTLGLKLMKRNGATVIAQNEETCVVYGMPKAPIDEGIVDVVAPLNKIADEICRTVK